VRFKPTNWGIRSAALTFTDNAGGPHSVALRGNGLASEVRFAPAATNFADQRVGTTSLAQQVTISNVGNSDLTIASLSRTGTDFNQFALGTQTCTGVVIPPAGSCTVDVTFSPTAVGAKSALLRTADNAPGSAHTSALTGKGIASNMAFSAAQSFGNQRTGTTSASLPLTVTNSGTASLTVSAITIAGLDADQFKVYSQSCMNGPIAPGGRCTVNVKFAPTSTGPKDAVLKLTDDSPAGSHTSPLTGTGIASDVSFDTPLNFGDQTTGTTSASQTLTVTNSGTASLTVGTVTIAGTDPTEFNLVSETCTTAAVAPGASCQVTVTFSPTTAGAKSAVVRLTDDAPGSPHTSALSGNGVDPIPPPAA
jgi:hypothetical protein